MKPIQRVVAGLAAAGADVNRANNSGTTAMHIAAEVASYSTVTALLAAGANANATDSSGRTPLQCTEGPSSCNLGPPIWSGTGKSIVTALRCAQKAQASRKRKAQQHERPRRRQLSRKAAAAAAPAAAAAEVRAACVISKGTL